MNVDLGIWGKLNKLVLGLIGLAILIGISRWYLPVIQRNERMRKEIIRLDGAIQKEEATGKQTREAIEAMRDPKVVERLAREKLGYAKPGETVVRFEVPVTNSLVR